MTHIGQALAFVSSPARARIEAAGRRFQAKASEVARKAAAEAEAARAAMAKRRMEAAMADRAAEAERLLFSQRDTRRTSRAIFREVCAKRGLPPGLVVARGRSQPLVLARHEAWWRIHHELGMSLADIGRRFGRDHTTVLHGVRKHQAKLRAAEAVQ